jgi:hypothetical protein
MLAACSGPIAPTPEKPLGRTSALESGDGANDSGKRLFTHALRGTNGRACASCHVESDHFALLPQHVTELAQANPSDPLFNPIDADDPTAATPTYDHLKAGLVRITLKLADNLDVIDDGGNVITNADRTINVWRGVPTVENTAYTAPFQYDDRLATLQIQADGALHAHSQIDHEPSAIELDHIADFERTVFSDERAATIAAAIEDGSDPPDLLPEFPAGSDGAAGKGLFKQICAQCHGGATERRIANQELHDEVFPVIKPDGTVDTGPPLANGFPVATNIHHDLPDHHDLDIGIAFGTQLGQLGLVPNLTGVSFPRYRIRFYSDSSRTQQVVDLPPPFPQIGPALGPEAFSVDPGRSIITGDPNDWEAFKVPQLRGVSRTAPYFHDGSAPNLNNLLDVYSEFILPAFPALNRPLVFPPQGPGLPPESLSQTEKAQLLAFLQAL